jgi:hypothetical protein
VLRNTNVLALHLREYTLHSTMPGRYRHTDRTAGHGTRAATFQIDLQVAYAGWVSNSTVLQDQLRGQQAHQQHNCSRRTGNHPNRTLYAILQVESRTTYTAGTRVQLQARFACVPQLRWPLRLLF